MSDEAPPGRPTPPYSSGKEVLDEFQRFGFVFDLAVAALPSVATKLLHSANSTDGPPPSFVQLLILTAPLTIGVAILTYRALNGSFETVLSFLISTVLTLLALAFLSRLTGIGKAIDPNQAFHDVADAATPTHERPHPIAGFGSLVAGFLVAVLGGYFELYGWATFVLSIGCGIYLGFRSHRRQ